MSSSWGECRPHGKTPRAFLSGEGNGSAVRWRVCVPSDPPLLERDRFGEGPWLPAAYAVLPSHPDPPEDSRGLRPQPRRIDLGEHLERGRYDLVRRPACHRVAELDETTFPEPFRLDNRADVDAGPPGFVRPHRPELGCPGHRPGQGGIPDGDGIGKGEVPETVDDGARDARERDPLDECHMVRWQVRPVAEAPRSGHARAFGRRQRDLCRTQVGQRVRQTVQDRCAPVADDGAVGPSGCGSGDVSVPSDRRALRPRGAHGIQPPSEANEVATGSKPREASPRDADGPDLPGEERLWEGIQRVDIGELGAGHSSRLAVRGRCECAAHLGLWTTGREHAACGCPEASLRAASGRITEVGLTASRTKSMGGGQAGRVGRLFGGQGRARHPLWHRALLAVPCPPWHGVGAQPKRPEM
jgi:hypothetical protein